MSVYSLTFLVLMDFNVIRHVAMLQHCRNISLRKAGVFRGKVHLLSLIESLAESVCFVTD